MRYRHRISFLLLSLLIGCKPPPEISPSKYAPESVSSIWINSKKEDRQLKRIQLQTLPQIDQSGSGNTAFNLLDLFQIGLSNNPETAKTFFDTQIAAASYGASRSTLYPDINLDIGFLRQRQGFVFVNNELVTIYTTTIGPEAILKYNILDFSKYPKIDTYFFDLLSANWTHNQEIQTVLKQIANGYYNYLYAKSLLEAFESDLIDASAMYKASQEKFDFGISDLTELMQAKSRYLQNKIDVTTQQARVKNSLVQLNTLLGLPATTPLEVLNFPDPKTLHDSPGQPNELLSIAQDARPDIKALKAVILQKQASIKEAQGQNFPKVDFTGSAGQFWYNGGVTDNGNWMLQFGIAMPIFTGYQITNEVRTHQAELKKAQTELTQLHLQVMQEVMVAYNDFVSSLEQLKDTAEYLEAAKTDYQGAFEGYKTGTKDILDVLNAQASLADARSKEANAVRAYFDAKTNITFAIGNINKNEAP